MAKPKFIMNLRYILLPIFVIGLVFVLSPDSVSAANNTKQQMDTSSAQLCAIFGANKSDAQNSQQGAVKSIETVCSSGSGTEKLSARKLLTLCGILNTNQNKALVTQNGTNYFNTVGCADVLKPTSAVAKAAGASGSGSSNDSGSGSNSTTNNKITKKEALAECNEKEGKARQTCRTKVNRCKESNSACLQTAAGVKAASKGSGQGGGSDEEGEVPPLAPKGTKPYKCGYGPGVDPVETRFNLGCLGTNPPKGDTRSIGPIEDMLYSFVRFFTAGVGLVMAASLIFAGIQYTTSSGNPENTAKAKKRIQDTLIALAFYLLIFGLVQYLVPGGLF